ncbi:MAG: carbamoyltransferase [Candidatus Margulisbacteria bacterium GWF2_35_9]|nr:MAG: carbamoyltransferase [Candidatus Margulisbacteria bacterium GWF2_35_9]
MIILGLSAYYHDSAAVIIENETIIAAAQEERFTRKKQDSRFPEKAINYCLSAAGIGLDKVDRIVFYDKPFIKFERLLETYIAEVPRGLLSFWVAIPLWIKEKLFLKDSLLKEFAKLSGMSKAEIHDKILFSEHHQSHAASAFYPSPFQDAAIVTLDGVGEWTTTSIAYGNGNDIKILKEIKFPHSLGLLYSAFTYYTGFKVNSGEYKVMGLAPYGEPIYVDQIKKHLIDIKKDGSFRLNMKYFNYATGLTMTNNAFHKLFGSPPRKSESIVTQKEMDLARSIQVVTEEIMIKIAKYAKDITGSKNLCLAGGVALNCVGNGEILRSKLFDNIWIQPAAGDAGGALGAAYAAYYMEYDHARTISPSERDKMQGAFLGPANTPEEIKQTLDKYHAVYEEVTDESVLLKTVAVALDEGKVVGWHQGRMEFGPRALGGRSILGDARSPAMQKKMNLKIKYRESFRPFAPSVLAEDVSAYFQLDVPSPYMLLVAPVQIPIRIPLSKDESGLFGIDKLNVPKSTIPAVTHVDYSARVQTIHKDTNPRYYKLIEAFKKISKCSVIVNTSFNVRGEPIVCSPQDSYTCFMRTEMDMLVIENFILYKDKQPEYTETSNWQNEFELD